MSAIVFKAFGARVVSISNGIYTVRIHQGGSAFSTATMTVDFSKTTNLMKTTPGLIEVDDRLDGGGFTTLGTSAGPSSDGGLYLAPAKAIEAGNLIDGPGWLPAVPTGAPPILPCQLQMKVYIDTGTTPPTVRRYHGFQATLTELDLAHGRAVFKTWGPLQLFDCPTMVSLRLGSGVDWNQPGATCEHYSPGNQGALYISADEVTR